MKNEVKVTVWLPADELAKFTRALPMHGAITWFFKTALCNFNKMIDFNLDDFVEEAVKEIRIG